jgi:hypothetical protein
MNSFAPDLVPRRGLLSGTAAREAAAERSKSVPEKGERRRKALGFQTRTNQEDDMSENGMGRVWVNRVVAFLGGALLLYAVMSLSVVKNVKDENKVLKVELYDADRLLTSAKGSYENINYSDAKATLDTLFEKHPSAIETVEGKRLYAEIEAEQNALDAKWESAMGAIREEWATTMATQMRAEFEKDREAMENNMTDVLNTEWEKTKGRIRDEWEQKS